MDEDIARLEEQLAAHRAILTWLLPELLSRFGGPPLQTLSIAKLAVLKVVLRTPPDPRIAADREAVDAYQSRVSALADAMLEDLRPILAAIPGQGRR